MNAPVKRKFQELLETSSLAGANAAYLEEMYENWLRDRNSVPDQWCNYFDQIVTGGTDQAAPEVLLSEVREEFREISRQRPVRLVPDTGPVKRSEAVSDKQVHVLQLINSYRFMGHREARINPLHDKPEQVIDDLDPAFHHLADEDMDTVFNAGSLVNVHNAPLRRILEIVRSTYCGSIGAEYMHITDTREKRWIQNYLEGAEGKPGFDRDKKLRIFRKLVAAEGLERYLHTRYVGQKRFSLEGAESLIPLLDEVIQRAGSQGVEEIAIGMAHRGRLNVLVNIMGKTPAELFMEFEGKSTNGFEGTGDVKYHMGFSSDTMTPGGPVHLALAFNPSHLEIVGPVVEGSVRARQQRREDVDGNKVVPVLVHGDAAFAGQGVVMETFNMSQSRGFSTKGTVHVVINNQIGFTTSNQEDARSTLYCTDVAKMVSAPILHVNGDDPEAVIFACQAAFDYRMTFHKDVVIDLVCYRRHGHSEADEPMATQPLMYQKIRRKPTTLEVYAGHLHQEKLIKADDLKDAVNEYRQQLVEGKSVAGNSIAADKVSYPYEEDWNPYQLRTCAVHVDTRVSQEKLVELHGVISELPDSFSAHPYVSKIHVARQRMVDGEIPVDWGFAETMAYASLLQEGYSVRLSGQDSGRGTFFHRHAAVLDQKTGSVHVPLRKLNHGDVNFLVINSLLSEEAVLAFEYGYATTDPNTLTIWEAQFGDFANNAQVVIDQFISAGEEKWNRMCGLVMLLPHGFEGQGPEHSSARLERYLQLCAQQNIQVCVPSNASQIFHLLRRQMLQTCRKPLVVMTPKSLLRHKDAASPLQDLTEGHFRRVIPPKYEIDPDKVRRIIMCSGKIYYDLRAEMQKTEREDIAIIRIEQLYPFPEKELRAEIARYINAERYVWCQEEPKNQGAWHTSRHHMYKSIGTHNKLMYAGRPNLAAPAVGLFSLHEEQLQRLIECALND